MSCGECEKVVWNAVLVGVLSDMSILDFIGAYKTEAILSSKGVC